MTMYDFDIRVPVAKADPVEGLVTGWASVVTRADGTQIIDSDGDIIPVKELEKAVHAAFTEHPGRGKAGDMHNRNGIGDIVESFVLTQEKRKALDLGMGPEGWIVTIKVTDPEILAKIKSGERLELSIRGTSEVEDDARTA